MADKISQELQDSLKNIVDICEREDKESYDRLKRIWRRNEMFWAGLQYLFWNGAEGRWNTIDDVNLADDELADQLGSHYDFVVDIFKAHGESIISALASQIPSLRHLPDDADNQEDVQTARTYNKIGDLIQRHNKAKLIFLQALFFMYVNGIVASYRYKDSDSKYGEYKVPEYTPAPSPNLTCLDCGYQAEDQVSEVCPDCGSANVNLEMEEKPQFSGYKVQPKTRVKIDVYGGLFFKIPLHARNQDECSYLIHYMEHPVDTVQAANPDMADELVGERPDDSDRFTRNQYTVDSELDTKNLITVKKTWIRPSKFYLEGDKDKRKALMKKFPDGARVELAGRNNIFLKAENESLDDRWELGKCGLSTFIHPSPKCTSVVPLQEMKNQLSNLTMETVEHGIPTEFADPQVLNFPEYGKFEVLPGATYRAKPVTPTAPLAQSFYTSPRATVSKEIPLLNKQIEQDAQFSLGSFPSIYGGPGEGNSRTYSEYAASRQMALQRLSIDWEFMKDWWVRTIEGSIKLYVETVVEDDRFTLQENGSYINVWIRQSDLQGKVGGVEPEAAEQFPVSLMQKKDLIMNLLQLQSPEINAALFTPENSVILQDVLALNEFKVPGQTQRVKQILEINEMTRPDPESGISPEPTVQRDPLTGQTTNIESTVPIDNDVDDHQIHINTLKAFLVDQIGLDLKKNNPQAYMNCIAHLRAHTMAMLTQTLGSAPGADAPAPGQEPASAEQPVTG